MFNKIKDLLKGIKEQQTKDCLVGADRPSRDTVDTWEDENLTAACWIAVADLCDERGFEFLNNVEKNIYCIMNFDNQVNNGGFEQYLFQTDLDLIRYTAHSLKETGCNVISELVSEVINSFNSEGVDCDFGFQRLLIHSIAREWIAISKKRIC